MDDGANRILYVEDDDELRELVADVLRAERYRVRTTRWAEAALEELSARPYGLLITDHHLPGRTGRWLVETARERGLLHRCGAIVLTAAQDVADFAPLLVMRKPVDMDLLVAEVAARLEAVAWAGRRPRSGIERRLEGMPSWPRPRLVRVGNDR